MIAAGKALQDLTVLASRMNGQLAFKRMYLGLCPGGLDSQGSRLLVLYFESKRQTLQRLSKGYCVIGKTRPVTLVSPIDTSQWLWPPALPSTESTHVLNSEGARAYPYSTPVFI